MKNEAGKTVYHRMSLRRRTIRKAGIPRKSICTEEKMRTNTAKNIVQTYNIMSRMMKRIVFVTQFRFSGPRAVGFKKTIVRKIRGTNTIHAIVGVRVAKPKVMAVLLSLSIANLVFTQIRYTVRLMSKRKQFRLHSTAQLQIIQAMPA